MLLARRYHLTEFKELRPFARYGLIMYAVRMVDLVQLHNENRMLGYFLEITSTYQLMKAQCYRVDIHMSVIGVMLQSNLF